MANKSDLLSGVVLFIAGLALSGGGVYFLKEKMDYFNNSIEAEGEVVDIESRKGNKTMYYPVIAFQTADGNTHTFSPDTGTSSSSDYTKGDKLMIKYKEENPGIAKIDSFKERWGLPLALLLAGIVILLSGGGTVYMHFYKSKLRKELPRTGTRLQLPGRVELKTTKNKTEFVIISDWLNPEDSKMYAFTSDKISFDPTSYIAGRLMDVWIDRMNPKQKNYVDISFLPEKA
jgi:hypothetical protein